MTGIIRYKSGLVCSGGRCHSFSLPVGHFSFVSVRLTWCELSPPPAPPKKKKKKKNRVALSGHVLIFFFTVGIASVVFYFEIPVLINLVWFRLLQYNTPTLAITTQWTPVCKLGMGPSELRSVVCADVFISHSLCTRTSCLVHYELSYRPGVVPFLIRQRENRSPQLRVQRRCCSPTTFNKSILFFFCWVTKFIVLKTVSLWGCK